MRDAIVQSVQGNSITIKTTAPGQKAELHTIPIASLSSRYQRNLKPGTRVQMLYNKLESGGPSIKAIKPVSHSQPE